MLFVERLCTLIEEQRVLHLPQEGQQLDKLVTLQSSIEESFDHF
jgi:hypothetical protein